ncbi:SusC/RagA family TonB-linked outer membrane protein [uncultured Mucilaginibacter sp.]|uniref:SusC/RagA family TonB-linked outer membrane protein n=1 Tax=uncultured Mucilaginibacter sp. TaxID=797541 RepID=UPI0025DFDF15|nr:SusC/RagA family TonB-linked outer membrane protein [uncultured Mucilaginibacter sp.]
MQFKNLLKVSLLALFCFFIVPAMAQNKTISGKVTDSKDGSPITGASVLAKGTTAGAITDVNGNFKLTVTSAATTVIVTYIGYDRKEVAITGGTLNITLEASSTSLNEVTVVSIGYGSARKKDLSGAVASISAKSFNQGAIINPVDQLSGKIAGLVITQPGGDPNQSASVRLRGQSSLAGGLSPLFVVDGIVLDDPSQFQNIPPDDIASYDVLKDASASAIYGSRGANGVIIVTTRKGSAGRTTISYDGLAGTSTQSKYYDLLNSNQLRAAVPALGALDHGANTDWQKAITRTAYEHRHNVSISGGSNEFNFIGSVNYADQQGIVINTDKKQLGLRFSAEEKALNDKLDIKAGIQNVSTTRSFIDYSNFSYIYNTPPTYPITNPDGTYYAYSDFNQANPVEHMQQSVFRAYEYLTLINGSADYSITNALKVGVVGSITRNNVQTHGFIPSFPLEGNVNQAGQAQENTNSYKGNIHINYDKTFGKSTLTLLGGYEYNDYLYDNFRALGQEYITPDQQDNNLSAGNSLFNKIYSYKQEYLLISFFARATYNYDSRIYLTATIRQDGSSKFGTANQRGYFPSFAAAYRFKNDLLSNVDWIDDIKIRAGYGITGNSDAIGTTTTLETVGPVGSYYNAATGTYPNAYSTNQNANPLLKWEQRKGRNIGLDFSLFKGRLTGDVNYFNDLTSNLLFNYTVPTPPFVYPSILANVGSLTNKGLEIALTGQIVKGPKFNWTTNAQITFVKTTVTNLSGVYSYAGQTYPLTAPQIPVGYAVGRGLSSNPITFLKPGYSPYVFYLPHYTGTDASGNQTFDGKTIAQNASPSGHYIDPAPKFTYGMTNNFDYGNWNFNFALRGVSGQKVFNNTLLDVETITRLPGNNVTKEALTNGIKDAPVSSDKWLEDASFLRVDNATLSYAFKNLSFANSLRVFISSNNLLIITKYRGLDPENKTENSSGGNVLFGNNLNGSSNQAYIDANYGGQAYYPRVRTITLGVNVSLK